jgi:hypothetical protein
MQKEIAAQLPDAGIRLLGVNAVGQERDNGLMCEERDLPWLQEAADDPIWEPWQVTYRDVVILDGGNEVYAVYNLSEHNLAIAENYAALEALLVQAWEDETR